MSGLNGLMSHAPSQSLHPFCGQGFGGKTEELDVLEKREAASPARRGPC